MVSLEIRLKRRLLLGVLLVSLVLGVTVRTQVHQQQRELLNYQLEQVARALILSDLPGTIQTWDDDPALHLDVQIWDSEGKLTWEPDLACLWCAVARRRMQSVSRYSR